MGIPCIGLMVAPLPGQHSAMPYHLPLRIMLDDDFKGLNSNSKCGRKIIDPIKKVYILERENKSLPTRMRYHLNASAGLMRLVEKMFLEQPADSRGEGTICFTVASCVGQIGTIMPGYRYCCS